MWGVGVDGEYKVPLILNILTSVTRDIAMETDCTPKSAVQLILCSGLESNFCVRKCVK
jgi:hypothetical protein